MEGAVIPVLNTLYGMLKDRPDLFITVVLLAAYLTEKSERKSITTKYLELVGKMHSQNEETNKVLDHIKFLLEVLTKGRR
jgi:hypothetical protein